MGISDHLAVRLASKASRKARSGWLAIEDTLGPVCELPAAEDQVGDRIGDNPRAISSDPFHDEQFVLPARAATDPTSCHQSHPEE
jgi:hypothetical protein